MSLTERPKRIVRSVPLKSRQFAVDRSSPAVCLSIPAARLSVFQKGVVTRL
jgi:hypothetical protein